MLDLKAYELYLRDSETAENTIKNYLNTLQQLDDYLVVNDIKELNKATMMQYKAHLRTDEFKPGKQYELSTVNQKIVAINIYFNWFMKEYELDDLNLKVKTYSVQNHIHRESINEHEFKALLKHSDEEMKLFILTIANTGLRISEVCQLKKEDLYTSIIEINNKGKTRIIAIPEFLKKKLKVFVKNRNDEDIIFNQTQTNYRKKLKKIAGKAKVKKSKVYPHSIRHYFAKSYISDGGDSTTLQQMLGHSNISTTTIYTNLGKEELANKFKTVANGR